MNNIKLFAGENRKKIWIFAMTVFLMIFLMSQLKSLIIENYVDYFLSEKNVLIFDDIPNHKIKSTPKVKIEHMSGLNLGDDSEQTFDVKTIGYKINLANILDVDNISKFQKTKNVKDYSNFKREQGLQISKLNVPSTERKSQIDFRKIGIEKRINGIYPTSHNQIMIGENLAADVMFHEKLTSLNQLVGKKITLDQKDYVISGVYKKTIEAIECEDEIEYISGKSEADSSSYMKFNSRKEKNKFLSDNKENLKVYKPQKYRTNYINISYIIMLIMSSLLLFLILGKSFYEFRNYVSNFKSKGKQRLNKYIFIVYFVFILIMLLIFWLI